MNHSITRSDFLQKTSLAGAAILLSSIESFSREEQKVIRVAIIGCGSVSNRYIVHLQSSNLIKIVSLCDIKIERAVAQNETYKIGANNGWELEKPVKGESEQEKVASQDIGQYIVWIMDNRRLIHPTPNNPVSSRSHMVICLTCIPDDSKR